MAERLDLRQLLMRYVARLSPANRETILLMYYEDFNLREIADALGISVNTVKGRLHRARTHLQTLLMNSEFDHKGERQMLPVKLVDVVLREIRFDATYTQKSYQLVLMNEEQRRALIIWVGKYEALQIVFRFNNFSVGRPLTQTFVARLVEATGATLERVEISDLKENVFYATVHMNINGETRQVDARPSDAIGLAVYGEVPLYVNEAVMAEIGFDVPHTHQPTGKGVQEIMATMESLEKSIAAARERMTSKPDFSNTDHEAEIVLSKVFAPS